MNLKQDLLTLVISAVLVSFPFAFPDKNYFFICLLFGVFLLLGRLGSKVLDWSLIALGVAFIYFSSFSGLESTAWKDEMPQGNYNKLALNYLNGHLEFPEQPVPKLLALPEPHPPWNRDGIPFCWDCSLYKTKYFLYFGSAPIVTVIIPFFLLTGSFPSEGLLTFLFGALAFVFAYLFAALLLEKIQNNEPTPYQKIFLLLLLLLCSSLPAVVRRPAIYEDAILAGVSYLLVSLYFFTRSTLQPEKLKPLIWSGLFWGLAVGSRPTAILGVFIFAGLFLSTPGLRSRWKAAFKYFLWGCGPIALIIAIHNYARFENPLEFGFRYQLSNLYVLTPDLSLQDFLIGIAAFLFNPPRWVERFPFMQADVFGTNWMAARHRYMNEIIIGGFFMIPYLWFLFFKFRDGFVKHEWPILGIILTSVLMLMIDSVAGISFRYEGEWVTLLCIAATVTVLNYLRRATLIPATLITVLLLYSINFGFFSSFCVQMNDFFYRSPELTKKLHAFYDPKTILPE